VLYAIKPLVNSFGLALVCRGRRPVVLDIDDIETSFAGGRAGMAATGLRGAVRRAGSSLRRRWDAHTPGTTRWMERHVGRAHAVTANTRALVERFGAAYLPSGRDISLFDPSRHDPEECRRVLGLSASRVLMFPGTPRTHKGLEDVTAALEMLQWPDARLVLVGGRDTGLPIGEELARRHPRWIVRLGRFGVTEMPAVIAAAHVVVVPQRDTPVARAQFPMKLTDAMAMAKPILSTRVGDIPAVVGDAAWLVAPSSPGEIARALDEIFGNPDEAMQRGRRARRLCEERYSFERLGAILAAVMDGLLQTRGGRHRPESAEQSYKVPLGFSVLSAKRDAQEKNRK
jgi:glycosyltransferase involved in cell wall biosynthesis